jgi:putative membrane protein
MKRLLAPVCACLIFAAVAIVPAASAQSSGSNSKFSAADEQYLKTSISGDLFEIIGGKWAQHHSKNAAVLRLANRLVSDHTKSLKDAADLAHSLGIDVPSKPTPSMQWELNMVRSLHGAAYNHWYASLEVFDHVQDIQEASDEVNDGTNKQIRDDAAKELPTLRIHLRLARLALAANRKG